MQIEIPYEIVAKRYPGLVKEVIAKLRKGKSQNKNADSEQLTWILSWGETIQCESFSEIMSGAGKPKPKKSFEEQVKERIERSSVHLEGKIGKWTGYAPTRIYQGPASNNRIEDKETKGVIPPEVVDVITRQEVKSEADRQRVAAMTDEERNAEIQANLQELSKYPGFAAVRIAVPTSGSEGIKSKLDRLIARNKRN